MLKVILLLHRRPDLTREEFERHWLQVQRPLLLEMAGLRGLVLNRILGSLDGTPPAYDGIAETWFDSPEALQAAVATPAGQAALADRPNFLDTSRLQVFLIEETVARAPGGALSDSADDEPVTTWPI